MINILVDILAMLSGAVITLVLGLGLYFAIVEARHRHAIKKMDDDYVDGIIAGIELKQWSMETRRKEFWKPIGFDDYPIRSWTHICICGHRKDMHQGGKRCAAEWDCPCTRFYRIVYS